ncbi:MAG TPA: serine/threonine-protein kinase [Gammaproteobacteria bacterium]|nr:serine/threonine-protein kinase [Gammaproteobacteria bacterium]
MATPAKLGKFVVTRELGKGTTGTVYLCHDSFQGKDVALKLYTIDENVPESDARTRRRLFFNEAYLVGKMVHPNILPIYDAGEEGGHCYVVMEYVRGAKPLTTFCQDQNLLPVRKVVEVVFKCAKALDYAHRNGLIHRDIKPGNILFTVEGDVRIVDFGVAQMAGNEEGQVKGLVGSPSYMAPEQMRHAPATAQTDLYSLGVVMYELLTGKRPYYGDNLSKLVHQIIYASPPPVHRLKADVPPVLEEITAKAIDKDPTKRYQSGMEFATALSQAVRKLDQMAEQMAEQERFSMLRRLPFFKDFTYPEIYEVLQASRWQSYDAGANIISEGEMDDSLLVVVAGQAEIRRKTKVVGVLDEGDCFGEAAFSGDKSTSAIVAKGAVTMLKVSATLLDRLSIPCQLRFHKVFLRSMIERLTSSERADSAKKASSKTS